MPWVTMVFCVPIKKLTITLRPTLRAIRLFHELWRICSATLMPFGAAGSGPRPGTICCAPITASGAAGGAPPCTALGAMPCCWPFCVVPPCAEPKARSTICCDLFCMVLLSIMVWYVLASPCVITAGR